MTASRAAGVGEVDAVRPVDLQVHQAGSEDAVRQDDLLDGAGAGRALGVPVDTALILSPSSATAPGPVRRPPTNSRGAETSVVTGTASVPRSLA